MCVFRLELGDGDTAWTLHGNFVDTAYHKFDFTLQLIPLNVDVSISCFSLHGSSIDIKYIDNMSFSIRLCKVPFQKSSLLMHNSHSTFALASQRDGLICFPNT